MANSPQKVFISYSRKDKEKVYPIVDYLTKCGIDCWIDKSDIGAGHNYMQPIIDAINECDSVLFFLTSDSQESVAVKKEIEFAYNKQKNIIPIAFDKDIKLQDWFQFLLGFNNRIYWPDEDQQKSLVKDLGGKSNADIGMIVIDTFRPPTPSVPPKLNWWETFRRELNVAYATRSRWMNGIMFCGLIVMVLALIATAVKIFIFMGSVAGGNHNRYIYLVKWFILFCFELYGFYGYQLICRNRLTGVLCTIMTFIVSLAMYFVAAGFYPWPFLVYAAFLGLLLILMFVPSKYYGSPLYIMYLNFKTSCFNVSFWLSLMLEIVFVAGALLSVFIY